MHSPSLFLHVYIFLYGTLFLDITSEEELQLSQSLSAPQLGSDKSASQESDQDAAVPSPYVCSETLSVSQCKK